MVFLPDKRNGQLGPIPDSIPISDFMLDEEHGRTAHGLSRDPFTCGLTGKTYSSHQVARRVELAAQGLAAELGWTSEARANNDVKEWDRVIAVFSVNALDTFSLYWAVHRLGGIVTPANAAYSVDEVRHQLSDSGAKALFTCASLLPLALKAAAQSNLPKNRVYLLDTPSDGPTQSASGFKTLDDLIDQGKSQPSLPPIKWKSGEGARRTAFLCYSSGTSGLPKGVMISHRNVIANVLQLSAYEAGYRKRAAEKSGQLVTTDVALGLLPSSHIYGIVVIGHSGAYRGDQTIVLPKFELQSYLGSIERFGITNLFLVPPIIITMLRSQDQCAKYDLSSVTSMFTGAAPLGPETAEAFSKSYPKVVIRQAYGLTETCTVITATHYDDIVYGSSGCLLPGYEARVVTPEGDEITAYDTPGELIVRSPSVALGYLRNRKATEETFEGGWMRTGDEVLVRKGPLGTEHIFITDRIKELIKVKGHQVAPAELESHLLSHPAVADCAVIAVPDDGAGEVPKAIVVKSKSAEGVEEAALISDIKKHVQDHKSRAKWLKGGVRFIDVVPKSPSGKILRRLLRDQEKEARRKQGSRL